MVQIKTVSLYDFLQEKFALQAFSSTSFIGSDSQLNVVEAQAKANTPSYHHLDTNGIEDGDENNKESTDLLSQQPLSPEDEGLLTTTFIFFSFETYGLSLNRKRQHIPFANHLLNNLRAP